jgi:hypothetical protein
MGKAARIKQERVKAPPSAASRGSMPSWLLPAAGAVALVAVVAVVLVLVLGGDSKSSAPTWPASSAMTGLLTGKTPWPANQEQLPGRLVALNLPELPQEGLALHIHQHLDIWVNGKKVTVPESVGIAETFISDLHTHLGNGVLHVESPTERSFYLGQFFGVWGVRLDARCVGGYCTDGDAKVRVYVDGKPVAGDPRNIELEPHREIVVTYGTRAQLPKRIPSTYSFQPGE